MASDIHARKDDHMEIAGSGRGAFQSTTTLLEEVDLVHQALPELSLDEIDLSVELFGKRLRAPLLIGAMTGGTEASRRINEELAGVAAELGIGFCLGSQRIMDEHPESTAGFRLRQNAGELLLVGNLGLVQAGKLGAQGVQRLADSVGADAMALHLNPAQELAQSGGDRDFRGCVDTLAYLSGALSTPLMVKETGCGISRQAGEALVRSGVRHVEVGGAGGTSWVRVESERDQSSRWLGEVLGEWGVPTAASLLVLDDLPLVRIAGGGLRGPLDLARALALGATACTVAQPVLVAYREGGAERAKLFLSRLIEGLRAICLLTGSRSASALSCAPRLIGSRLQRWGSTRGGSTEAP